MSETPEIEDITKQEIVGEEEEKEEIKEVKDKESLENKKPEPKKAEEAPASACCEHMNCSMCQSCNNSPFFKEIMKTDCYEEFLRIVYWRDLIKTSIYFVVMNAIFFLLSHFNVCKLFTRLFMIILLGSWLYSTALKLFGRKNVRPLLMIFPEHTKIEPSYFENWPKYLSMFTNETIDWFRDLIVCKDPSATIQTVISTWIFYLFVKWVSLPSLLWFCCFNLFIWPRIYELKKDLIDSIISTLGKLIHGYMNMVLEKLPPSLGPIKFRKTD